MADWTTIEARDGSGSFACYRATPDGEARGAVIVIQEIFGINAGIQRKCDRLAEAGYLAFAPDLFWRLEPQVTLDPDLPGELQQGIALMKRFDADAGVADLEATIAAARREGGCRVGAVGYCLGGRLAYMVATRTDADASIGYYGAGIDTMLDERHAIARPLMLHIPSEDHATDAAAQATIHAVLDDHPRVTLYDYPGAHHGFATEFGKRREEAAAQRADERTMAFLAEHVG